MHCSRAVFIPTIIFLAGASPPPPVPGLAASVADYARHFGPFSPTREIVDDHGHGPAGLDGTRNMRAVLPGILYR